MTTASVIATITSAGTSATGASANMAMSSGWVGTRLPVSPIG